MSSQIVRTNNANFLRTHFLYDITGFHYLCNDKKLFYEKNYNIFTFNVCIRHLFFSDH